MEEKTDNHGVNQRTSETAGQALTDEERRVWVLLGFDDLPRYLGVAEAGKVLGVARSTTYALVNSKQLGSLHIGRCRRVPRNLLFDFVMQHIEGSLA